MIVGTNYFVSFNTACRYYENHGTHRRRVRQMVDEGLIHIGKPPLKADGSERWVLLNNGTRYGVEDSK